MKPPRREPHSVPKELHLYAQRLIIGGVVLFIATTLLETNLLPGNPNTLLPKNLPANYGPDSPIKHLGLTIFLTAKISGLLFLNLGLHALTKSLQLHTLLKIPLLILGLGSLLFPPLITLTLLCIGLLLFYAHRRSTH